MELVTRVDCKGGSAQPLSQIPMYNQCSGNRGTNHALLERKWTKNKPTVMLGCSPYLWRIPTVPVKTRGWLI